MDTANLEANVNQPVEQGRGNTNMEKANFRMFIFGLVGLIAFVAIVIAGLGIYRVYAKASTDGFTATVARILRLPALKVGSERILYTDYVDDMKAIHIMRDYDKANKGAGASLTEQQMTDQVLWRLANIVLVDKAAQTYNIKVEDKDISALKAEMMQQFKDTAAADQELMKRFGWTYVLYEQKVMRPFVLQSKLAEKLQLDQALREETRNSAQKVLDEIKNGADFAEMAKKYGSDATAAKGGDLGWFGKGEMVPQFEQAVFSLKKSELYPTLVETDYGYHIIKLEDKKTEQVKDAKGKMVSAEKAQARHILFRFMDLGQYLDKLAKSADIHLYLRVHNPFTDLKK